MNILILLMKNWMIKNSMKKIDLKKIDKATIIRVTLLICAIINQIIAALGSTTFAQSSEYQIISTIVLVIIAVVNAWENNDITYFASLGTQVLNALEDGHVSEEEVQKLLDKALENKSDESEGDNL